MTRREFLITSLGGVGSVARAATAPDLTEAMPWVLRLSTSSIQFRDLPIEGACRQIASLGFEAIDIWSAYENCPHLDSLLNGRGGAGLKELLAQHGLRLGSFSTYVGGYAKYAKLLGEAGGGLAIQGSTAPCAPGELTARMKRFLEGLKPLEELAAQHQSRLAIENHGHALLDGLDSLKAFVDRNASPRIGIALAPYHLQAGNLSVPEAIEICGSQLFFFYAWQNAEGLGQLPGHGPTDFKPWLQTLARIRYPGLVNAFMHGHPAPQEMASALGKAKLYLQRCVR